MIDNRNDWVLATQGGELPDPLKQYRVVWRERESGRVERTGPWLIPVNPAIFTEEVERMNKENPFWIREIQTRIY